jgi:thiol-disulfide isomerase/thioredoxin
MNSLHLGPFAISLSVGLLVAALIVALAVGAIVGRGRKLRIVDTLLLLVLIGLVVARIVFVLRYLPQYMSAPWSVIDIRDGGFDLIGGLVAGGLAGAWLAWRKPALRTPLSAAVAAGVIGWVVLGGAIGLIDNTRPSRPEVVLTKLDGLSIPLQELARQHPGEPMVVNLWATWCPPCRAEMPTLAAAQRKHSNVVFVFVNQGESAAAVRRFMREESISPANVLLDMNQHLARATHVRAYPTTLFFNADGKLVDRHLGMLSRATLARALNRLPSDPKELHSS